MVRLTGNKLTKPNYYFRFRKMKKQSDYIRGKAIIVSVDNRSSLLSSLSLLSLLSSSL